MYRSRRVRISAKTQIVLKMLLKAFYITNVIYLIFKVNNLNGIMPLVVI